MIFLKHVLKGPYHDQVSFYMLKHTFCCVQRHICLPYLIFDSPTINQKLKFLALVRQVKMAIRYKKWHAKLAIRNNKWHTKLTIQNKILDSLFCVPLIVPDSHFHVPLIVPDSHFYMPLIVPDSHFHVPLIVPDSHFYMPLIFSFCLIVGLSKIQLGQQICLLTQQNECFNI